MGLDPLRTLLLGGEGGLRVPPDPPATFGHANTHMLAMLAFPIGA